MERSLAHIEEIVKIDPIAGADRIALATVLGWHVIINKTEYNVGDKCVYFEIDSLLPKDDERYKFLESKNYKVKTMKLGKFGVISQGLTMPLSEFPELGDLPVGTDVTETLRVTYYNPEDVQRKSSGVDPNAKYRSMASRHKDIFKLKPFRWLMRREWGKKFLFIFFGKKKDNPKRMPSWIVKTDEPRCESMPFIFDNTSKKYSVTEKVDGTSTSFGLEHIKKDRYDFSVCSRNVRQKDRNQDCYHESNVYWEMADKYDIEKKLLKFATENAVTKMYLQGETYGSKVQGNPLKIDERRFAAFNLWVDGKRYTNEELFDWCDKWDIPHVPLIFEHHQIPDNIDDMKVEAEGNSVINTEVLREGLVYRDESNPEFSFKNVANSYLLSRGE